MSHIPVRVVGTGFRGREKELMVGFHDVRWELERARERERAVRVHGGLRRRPDQPVVRWSAITLLNQPFTQLKLAIASPWGVGRSALTAL